MDIASLTVTAVITILLLALGHYVPWRLLIGKKLPRVAAYTWGVASIALPYSVLLVISNMHRAAVYLWVVVAAGGACTVACYCLDKFLEFRSRALESEEREQRLIAQRTGHD